MLIGGDSSAFGSKLLFITLGLHLSLQSGFTIAMHSRPIIQHLDRIGPATLGIACLVGGLALLRSTFHEPRDLGISLDRGEMVYRLFMSFYGLVFPAYALICMKPWRKAVPAGETQKLILFGVCTVIAAPFYWLGFISGIPWALAAGVMIVLAGWGVSEIMLPPKPVLTNPTL